MISTPLFSRDLRCQLRYLAVRNSWVPVSAAVSPLYDGIGPKRRYCASGEGLLFVDKPGRLNLPYGTLPCLILYVLSVSAPTSPQLSLPANPASILAPVSSATLQYPRSSIPATLQYPREYPRDCRQLLQLRAPGRYAAPHPPPCAYTTLHHNSPLRHRPDRPILHMAPDRGVTVSHPLVIDPGSTSSHMARNIDRLDP